MKVLIEINARIDNSAKKILEPLLILTIAPLSHYLSDKKSNSGIWQSSSPYIGRLSTGRYFVWKDHPGGFGLPASHIPIGFFFDENDGLPFMGLFNFLPISLGEQGGGLLNRPGKSVENNNVWWVRQSERPR